MKRQYELDYAQSWLLEDLMEKETYFAKKMFGSLAVYYQGRMVCLLAEDSTDKTWKGKTYEFALWNGLLLPTEREHHVALKKDFKGLVEHPVLPKWLYLPLTSSYYEKLAPEILSQIQAEDPRLGIYPKLKIAKKKRTVQKKVRLRKKTARKSRS